jgi:GntR family transcriptional regulator
MAGRRLDRDSSVPLWRQLQQDLLERLSEGSISGSFPGELALTQEYEVSRHTVRQALRQLRADGVVVAERGRQARVAPAPEIEQPLGALYSLFASVEAAGQVQRTTVRVLDIRADGIVAERLDLEASTPLLYLERLRYAGAEPLALDRAWLPADIARPLLDADFSHTSLYGELATRAGIRLDRGEEQIRAAIPTKAEQELLKTTGAVFSIGRRGFGRGRPLEWRHTVVRGDRFALTAEFSARAGYRLTP